MFEDERALVDTFLRHIQEVSSPWGEISVNKEFFYSRGRTDVVAVSGEGKVFAFEAKLKDWRVALHQAYRNRCFADHSYVILPEVVASHASHFSSEFARRGVGLCFVSDNGLTILHEAPNSIPLQPWLRQRAAEFARDM